MDTLTDKEVKAAIPEMPAKCEMVMIDRRVWKRGPDGLWYRLDDGSEDGPT